MDQTKNKIPRNVQTIHIIAVCGTGMGALAGMLMDAGYRVTGSDANVYPPMSTFLAHKGIRVNQGFDPGNLDYGPDLVIIGNAVSKGNPEVGAVRDKGLYYCSFPEAMNRFFTDGKTPLLITGTHGKTTTSAILAWIIAAVGLDPTFMIGGILKNFDSNHHVGVGPYVVIEGDEYDTAFFDKRPKFLHYHPSRTILTSVEFDHADIYADLDAVKGAFSTFVNGLDPNSMLVHFDADANIAEVSAKAPCWKMPYGKEKNSPYRLGQVHVEPPNTRFEVFRRDALFGEFTVPLMGEHNLLNCLAAIAVADDLRIPEEGISKALETFAGVRRRQEVRGVKNGVTVLDDFAHHPTAVRETLKAVKPFYPDGRLIAVFEPRTNSSRRSVFQKIYPESFAAADLICVRQAPMLEKIPEGERFSSEQLVADLCVQGKNAVFFAETDGIIAHLAGVCRPGDVVLIMSNGGFDNIHERLLDAL